MLRCSERELISDALGPVCVFLQLALTALVLLVHTARFGKPRRTPAACTAATMTPSSQWSTTAPTLRSQCAIELGK